MMDFRYVINGFWGAESETPKRIAERFNMFVDHLAQIDPAFGNWIWGGAGQREPIAFAEVRGRLADAVTACVLRDEGDPEPYMGYAFFVLNSLETTPRSISVSVHSGSRFVGSFYSNRAGIETDWDIVPDPALVTYRIFREALLALAESFDVAFCSAYPSDIGVLWQKSMRFHFGWINYVAPRFAHLVTPPQSAIVEHRPNRALLMSATDETFVTANPGHLGVARDIERALAPLNALPWPLFEDAR